MLCCDAGVVMQVRLHNASPDIESNLHIIYKRPRVTTQVDKDKRTHITHCFGDTLQ